MFSKWKILTVRSRKDTLDLLMFSKSFLSCALMAALVLPVGAQGDNTGVGIWSIGNVFMDAGLTPLTGAANPGEGGDLIQVGYFNGVSSSTAAASFGASEWDTFTAISGLGSANAHILTEVTPSAGPTGIFTFSVEWLATDALPSDFGFRIGLRIFDGNTVASSSGFNTVVSENWYMPPPSFPDPIPPTLFLDTDPLVFQGTPWITNLAVVPEPSPALLLLVATALFLHRRHRR